MSGRPGDQPAVVPSLTGRIDIICDQYERQLKSGQQPVIEDHLAGWEEPRRSELLREMLFIELDYGQSSDSVVSQEEFCRRFPDDTAMIAEVFAIVQNKIASPTVWQETTQSPDRDVATSALTVGGRFGDYEILEEIARGGMGVVYKARQTKLNRTVALKMIKSGQFADDNEVRRFRAEAEAAAALDHPNIVPIYEVGEHEGNHFFSMGFVDGESLDAKLKEGPLPPKEAAELLKTIAEAVQYAHEKGIVHRDLKPANVLLSVVGGPSSVANESLGREAANVSELPDRSQSPTRLTTDHGQRTTPRITDYGLAKNISGDSGMTATGQILGTPSYMPPEQAAGDMAKVGPLADVYSLGAMLYATLTGRPPFHAANVMETLRQVLEREPVSPRTLNPAVDKDLETICLKCLEKDSAKRYASAKDLASDLNRYDKGKPIAARPLGCLAKTYRWCRRNRSVAAVIVMSVMITVVSPIVAVVQFELREEADTNRTRAEENLALFKAEKDRADRKVVELGESLERETKQKDRAKRNLDRADEVVNTFLTEIGKEGGLLSLYPATQPLRKKLLTMSREYYDKLIADNPAAQLSPRLAEAHYNVAFLLQELSGDMEEAIAAYQRALNICKRLAKQKAEAPNQDRFVASIHDHIGLLYMQTGRLNKALTAFLQAGKIFERLARENPDVARHQIDLALNHENIGEISRRTGKSGADLQAYLQSLKIYQQLTRQFPASAAYKKGLASAHHSIGAVYHSAGKPAKALAARRRALEIIEPLAKENPGIPGYSSSLASTLNGMAESFRQTGEMKKALSAVQRALRIREDLAKRNPTVLKYQTALRGSHLRLGAIYLSIGKHADALKAFHVALEIVGRMARENPTVVGLQQGLALCHHDIGAAYGRSGKHPEAIQAYSQAVKIYDRLVRENPKLLSLQRDLELTYTNIGDNNRDSGKMTEALHAYQKALQFDEELISKHPDIPEYQQFPVAVNTL